MKIKNIKCSQFAGIKDRDILLSEGMNIIIGENESGKSTTADLIYKTLFQSVKLSGKSDKDFIDTYFPNTSSGHLDCIDGTIVFSGDEGEYTLKKEWTSRKSSGTEKLKLPGGSRITDDGLIREELKKVLEHGEGIYNEIVFSSQKRLSLAVKAILSEMDTAAERKELKGTIDAFSESLSKAVSETGGVNTEKLEDSIKAKMEELSGNWDTIANTPEGGTRRGINNPWKKNVGKILAAYYEKETIRAAQEEALKAETDIDDLKRKISLFSEELNKLREKKEQFLECKGKIDSRLSYKESLDRNQNDLTNAEAAKENWPAAAENLKKSKDLKQQQNNAQIRSTYNKCFECYDTLNKAMEILGKLRSVDEDDLKTLSTAENNRGQLENKLKGMNLSAKIKKLGATDISIRSAVTGKEIAITDEPVYISEAVIITIPGITEIELSPKDIDTDAVTKELSAVNDTISAIYTKYAISSADELTRINDAYNTQYSNVNKASEKFDIVLDGRSWEEVCAENALLPKEVPSPNDVDAEIIKLCGKQSIDGYIGMTEREISAYEQKYNSLEELSDKISELNKNIEKTNKKLSALDDIPQEFLKVNAESFEESLKLEIKQQEDAIQLCNDGLQNINVPEKSSEEYREELEEKERIFEQYKEEYRHWDHILAIYNRVKERKDDSPVKDIGERFEEYLAVISDNRISLNSPIDEKFNVSLTSKNNALTYDTLSNGTKDTISLAFRLAMLEHIFPNGGGLAVFDDPFTEMSPERTKQSCKLIEKFAEKNQVIFITCDDKYINMLSGNIIRM